MTDMNFPVIIENDAGLEAMPQVAFDTFSSAFGYSDFTYQQSLSNAVRINHTSRVFSANEAPPDVEIFLHHEMAHEYT